MIIGPVPGRYLSADDTWSHLFDPRMPEISHGWKLHVSARADELSAVTELVLPIVLQHVCHAKFAKDEAVLRRLSAGVGNPASVGKAITVYPEPGGVAELAGHLVAALRGRDGPRVVSDRRVHPDAPVYYRYGPFQGTYLLGASGRPELLMAGPDGTVFDGLAGTAYRCPPWAADPFAPPTTAASSSGRPVLGGGRYRITAGIARLAQGNVYRAVDQQSGLPVVVKEARAHVAQDLSGADARDRLRHERRVLAMLDGVAQVPGLVDYFRHGPDEYLAMTDCGGRDLRQDVLAAGPYIAAAGPRSAIVLAAQLLAIAAEIHTRGVTVCDIKPGNIVLDDDGRPHLVDFGVSRIHGEGPDGGTAGYSIPCRLAAGRPGPADDFYALGATLTFALTGVDPVTIGTDPAVNRDHTIAGLGMALPGPDHQPIRQLIADLLSSSPARRTEAAGRLRAGTPLRARPGKPLPCPPPITPGLLDDIIGSAVAFCSAQAAGITDPRRPRPGAPPTIDMYDGSAGLGLELLCHTGHDGVPERIDELARWTAQQTRDLSASFYAGWTGVELFLTRAGVAHPAVRPGNLSQSTNADQITGTAGTGTAHLLLAQHERAAGHHAAVGRHLASAEVSARALTSGTARLKPPVEHTNETAALPYGFAHGTAGVAYFLLEYAHMTGDRETAAAAETACARLASIVPGLVEAALTPGATIGYASWCRGLAGIGAVLVRAADRTGELRWLGLAEQAARTCTVLMPRTRAVTTCCGLAGIGELLVDVAAALDSPELWADADTVAQLILCRSGGDWSHPQFPDASTTEMSAAWATGSAGVLGFLRRLRAHGGPRMGMIDP